MKYQKIKESKLTHKQIAKNFGYKNVNAFRCSSAHERIMNGIENILNYVSKDNCTIKDS
jgi:hypothetical protein